MLGATLIQKKQLRGEHNLFNYLKYLRSVATVSLGSTEEYD